MIGFSRHSPYPIVKAARGVRANLLIVWFVLAGIALTFTWAAAGEVVTFSLNLSAPTMTDRMVRDGVPSTCNFKSYPGDLGSTTLYRYRFSHRTYRGPHGCVTFKVVSGGTCAHLSLYFGSFDPADRRNLYFGDTGNGGNGREMSVRLSTDTPITMVVNDVATTMATCDVVVRAFITPAAHDFDSTGTSDIAWRQNGTGAVALWMMNDGTLAQTVSLGAAPNNWSIVGQRDFNGDGKDDLLWRETTSGTVAIWFLDPPAVTSTAVVASVPTTWSIVGTHDFKGHGKSDLLWRDTSGNIAIWLMNGAEIQEATSLGQVPTDWSVAAVADFNGDGLGDILWRNANTGAVAIWFINRTTVTSAAVIATVPTTWSIVGTGDFYATGQASIVWRDATGQTAIWQLKGAAVDKTASLGTIPTNWAIVESGDFNADGFADLLWRDTNTGAVAIWFMNGATVSSAAVIGTVPSDWVIQNVNVN
jgi:hypothetical protein